ncbi:unnamed protein product [Musa hybrid cultivar]
MKSANILLDDNFNPKLSDFGLAKLGPIGDRTHVSTRVMGTYGYCAPDYAMSGKLTLKSDFRPFLNDRRKFSQLVDPSLEGRYPPRAFHQLVVIASMCLQEQAHVRPIVADVVFALDHVASQPYVQGSDSKIIKSSPSPS